MGADRRRFGLDTNVLIYAVEAGGGAKARQAEAMVRQAVATRRCVLAVQNIGEFYAACVRKRHAAPAAAAARAADFTNLFATVAAGIDEVRLALAEAAGGRFSYWDALLLATLGRAGCTVLLSEDMADGARSWAGSPCAIRSRVGHRRRTSRHCSRADLLTRAAAPRP